jgi:hypothetical protein
MMMMSPAVTLALIYLLGSSVEGSLQARLSPRITTETTGTELRLLATRAATTSKQGWWTVTSIELFSSIDCSPGSKINPALGRVDASSYLDGVDPSKAFDTKDATFWAGFGEEMWISISFAQSISVRCVKFNQPHNNEYVTEIALETKSVDESEWKTAAVGTDLVQGENTLHVIVVWTASPSTPLPTKAPSKTVVTGERNTKAPDNGDCARKQVVYNQCFSNQLTDQQADNCIVCVNNVWPQDQTWCSNTAVVDDFICNVPASCCPINCALEVSEYIDCLFGCDTRCGSTRSPATPSMDTPYPTRLLTTTTPTVKPTKTAASPTMLPTPIPTGLPTTEKPLKVPTRAPTASPTSAPPTVSPTTVSPTITPATLVPTFFPTTVRPTLFPTLSECSRRELEYNYCFTNEMTEPQAHACITCVNDVWPERGGCSDAQNFICRVPHTCDCGICSRAITIYLNCLFGCDSDCPMATPTITPIAVTAAPTAAPTAATKTLSNQNKCFDDGDELRAAALDYVVSGDSFASKTYGSVIGDWCTGRVQDFSHVFDSMDFNKPLDGWDMSSAVTLKSMFAGNLSFNQSIGHWNVSSVTSFFGVFSSARSFNQPLDGWDTRSATSFFGMFAYSPFNQSLSHWKVDQASVFSNMFLEAPSFNQDLSAWNLESATDLSGMFKNASSFQQNLCSWGFPLPKSVLANDMFLGTICPMFGDPNLQLSPFASPFCFNCACSQRKRTCEVSNDCCGDFICMRKKKRCDKCIKRKKKCDSGIVSRQQDLATSLSCVYLLYLSLQLFSLKGMLREQCMYF